MAGVARLELRIDPEQKRLIEQAAAAEHQSVSAFVVDALVRRARAELPYPDPGHRDAFDRMLVSQALVEGVALLTADGRLGAYESLGLRIA